MTDFKDKNQFQELVMFCCSNPADILLLQNSLKDPAQLCGCDSIDAEHHS